MYFDKAEAFKIFSQNVRSASFAEKKTKKNTRRAHVESEPESESNTEPHSYMSIDDDDDIGADFSFKDTDFPDIEDYDSDTEMPMGAIEDIIRNLARVSD